MRSRWALWRTAGAAASISLLMLGAVTAAQDRPPGGPGGGGPRGPGRMGPGGPGGGLPPGFMRLNLSEQQRTQARAIMEQNRETTRSVREQVRTLHQQLTAAVYTTAPNTIQVNELTMRLADAQRQVLEADIAVQLQLAAMLTDEQRAQLVQNASQRPPRPPAPPR